MGAPAATRPPGVHVDGIISWGRTLDEYRAFFALDDLSAYESIVDVGAGPASFTAEVNELGTPCTAVDPMYVADDVEQIRAKFEATRKDVLTSFEKSPERFLWGYYGTPERLQTIRRGALERCLVDRAEHASKQRYVPARLPALPFEDGAFDLALCSHMLFLYSHVLDVEFHLRAVEELLRIAREVRIYPLVALEGGPSPYLEAVVNKLRETDVALELVPVKFEHLPGATKMLRIFA
jgi:SAM-dependent methyltransferase